MLPWHNELAETLSLDGEWRFTLQGKSGAILTPGGWEAQGFDRRAEGPAIYERKVAIPAAWSGKTLQIQFDAVSYYVEVELNGVPLGSHTGAWTPFALDATAAAQPGEANHLRLTVFKTGQRFPMRESLAGFLPDVALMFGGVWQSARLVAFDGPALGDIHLTPDADTGEIAVSAAVHNGQTARAVVIITAPDGQEAARWESESTADSIQADLRVPQPALWSPAHPALYTVEIQLIEAGQVRTTARRRFGFRRLSRAGDQLLLNGQPACLRGVLNWGWYPEQLCPAPTESAIRAEFRRVRALGFNLVKLCLVVPAPLYFDIADEEGMLLWLELPMWLPEVTPRLRAQAPLEYADILAAVHHHPAIVLYSLGCELNRAVDETLLGRLDAIVRGQTSGVLVCDNSGSGEAYGGLSTDYADFNDYHFYADLQYFEPLVDHFDRDWRAPRPWIFGEFCDADDYRDLDEIEAAHGGTLPWWLTEWNPLHPKTFVGYPAQRERMQKLDLGLSGQEIQALSWKQSFVVRKAILEKVRARHGMGGYVVTGLRNTPLATSAILDDLERLKYPPEAFRAFNADSVLLPGRGRTRRWINGGDRPAPFEPYAFPAGQPVGLDVLLAHAGAPLPGGTLAWELRDSEDTLLAHGMQTVPGPLPAGNPRSLTRIAFIPPALDRAAMHRLTVRLTGEGLPADLTNTWPLWIFPAVTRWPDGLGLFDPAGSQTGLGDLLHAARPVEDDLTGVSVLIAGALSEAALAYLRGGGRVLLLQHGPRPLPAAPRPFWREGIKLIQPHPVWEEFPHEGFVDLQFYGLATDWVFAPNALTNVLPDLTGYRPLLRRLDARQFDVSDYLFEAQVGKGRLIASTLRFEGGLGDQPLSLDHHLAGRWLLDRLLARLLAGEEA